MKNSANSYPVESVSMLPDDFEFSQASLQDYADCQRRFQLKYLESRPWPAIEVEPLLDREASSAQGRLFHRMVERYYAGIPEDVLEAAIQDDQIATWWRAFRDMPPLNLPSDVLLPEVRLATTVAGRRLVGVFDLLAVEPGRRLVIVDWKTGRRPDRVQMENRLQTLVYPYMAVEAGTRFFGELVDPARVTMVYWFAMNPDQPHVFHYSEQRHREVGDYLAGLMEEIAGNSVTAEWPLAVDERRCRYCAYRSLCRPDVGVANSGEFEDFLMEDVGFVFSLDDVDELEY